MRIALVANAYPPAFIGGAEIAAHRQAVELVRRGHVLSCFCGWSDPSEPAYAVYPDVLDGVAVTRINVPAHRFTPLRGFANGVVDALFARFLERERLDVVHFHNLPGLSVGLLDVAEAAGLPMMVTFHDHWGFCLRNTLVRAGERRVCPDWTGCEACLPEAELEGAPLPTFMRTDLVRAKLHKASRFHFPSRYLADAYGRALFDPGRMVSRSNGVRAAGFPDDAPRAVRRPIRLAYVGRLDAHKGPGVLLDALEHVAAAGRLDAFTVDVYGEGTEAAAIEGRLAALGWRGRVTLHGRIAPSAAAAAARESDLLVNGSLWPENEPVTILEALSAGTPVVATAMGGNPELVREGVNGWLYPAGDALALAARLTSIADNPAPLFAMRPAVRASVADRTLAAYADFAEASYAALRPVGADGLPSLVAVVCEDFAAVDTAALRRAARSGVWNDAEWVPAEALRGAAERDAIRAVVGLNGRLAGPAADALARGVPGVAVGRLGLRALAGARDVRYAQDLDALAALGLEATGPRAASGAAGGAATGAAVARPRETV